MESADVFHGRQTVEHAALFGQAKRGGATVAVFSFGRLFHLPLKTRAGSDLQKVAVNENKVIMPHNEGQAR